MHLRVNAARGGRSRPGLRTRRTSGELQGWTLAVLVELEGDVER
jgi:hypothetical protein